MSHHYPKSLALIVMQVYWAAFLISSFIISFFMKKISRCILTIKVLAFLHFIVFIIFIMPIIFNFSLVITIVILAGIATSGNSIAYTILAIKTPDNLIGSVISVNNTFGIFGGLCGQLLFGFIIASVSPGSFSYLPMIMKNYYYALLLLPVAALMAFISLMVLLKKPTVR